MRFGRILAVLLVVASAMYATAPEREIVLSQPLTSPMPEYPPEILAAGRGGVVESIVGVNIDGVVESAVPVEAPDKSFEAPTAAALRKWTFTPTRVDGTPSKYAFVVPLEFSNGVVRLGAIREMVKPDTMPKLLKLVEPEYPRELIGSNIRGKAVVSFVLSARGEVLAPEIVEVTHPAFEEAALAAIVRWQFAPAKAKGKPVPLRVAQPIQFVLPGGVNAFKVRRAPKKNVPEEERVDTPPQPKIIVAPVHPFDEAIRGKTGEAFVRVFVGANGKVALSTIRKASSPEFGLALATAVEAWTFDPAQRDGQPVGAFIAREHKFGFLGRDATIDLETEAIARRIKKGNFESALQSELDSPQEAKVTVAPVYPTVWIEKGIEGSAVIEVIVDKKGRAVLPRIVEASEPEFGWAAATAAQRWRFDPPKVKGKPVEVKVVISFKFVPPEPEPEEEVPVN